MKEEKTKVGKFLQKLGSVGKPILEAAAGLTGQDWLIKIVDAIGKNKEMSVEEKTHALTLCQLDLKDMQHARETNMAVQEAEYASWAAKNMPFAIDAFVLLVWGLLTIYLGVRWMGYLSDTELDMTGLMGMYAGVTALASQIISYHRGSSAGSALKNKKLFGG